MLAYGLKVGLWIKLAALGRAQATLALLSLAQFLDKIGCARQSPSNLGSALTCTFLQPPHSFGLRVRRSSHAPKGQKHPAQGKRAKRCDTLGFAASRPMRPEGAKAGTEWVKRGDKRGHMWRKNSYLPLLLPLRGVSEPILPNPGCRIATLACPGLGAHCPFGARVERLLMCSIKLAALGRAQASLALLSLAHFLDKIGCARHSPSKLGSALTCTFFQPSRFSAWLRAYASEKSDKSVIKDRVRNQNSCQLRISSSSRFTVQKA